MLGLLPLCATAVAAADELHAPALTRLPAGAIQPRGWLQAQAELQGNGMTGALGYFGGGISASLWLEHPNGTEWLRWAGQPTAGESHHDHGDRWAEQPAAREPHSDFESFTRPPTGGSMKKVEEELGAQEEQGGGYYLNGMIPLSCQVDLPHLRALRDASIPHILKSVADPESDGFIGPALPNMTNGKNPDIYWGRMSLVLGLEAFVECTGPFAPPAALQQQLEAALVKHHIAFGKHVAAADPVCECRPGACTCAVSV